MTTPLLPSILGPADLRRLSIPQLQQLAQEIREAIFTQVSHTGGHLAPNLGVVELTIALHFVFDFSPEGAGDRLLFDVGHQCYPHKLLTGRLPLLSKLRTREGMAGFPDPRESAFDLFAVGHAGTAISTAVGMARGDSLNKHAFDPKSNPTGKRVVSLIGDASIVNGVAMEGLNNAGTLKRQFLVVLNDNGMSISKPQGAVAHHFDKLRISQFYNEMKKSGKEALSHMPGGSIVRDAYHAAGEAMKAMIGDAAHSNAWFEHFGLKTVGPIDGHDLPTLIEFLREARDFDRPMVLHVKTVKGKGYEFAEDDSTTFHSPPAFKVEGPVEGDPTRDAARAPTRVQLKNEGRSFTTAFADAMIDLMERDAKVVTCTAAMPDGTGLNKVIPRFPDRAWDTGICESHALDMMAGLAKSGFKPFFAVYATFFQRAFDQAFQEAALQGLAVRLCLDRAGLVGGDGAVHHGFCDTALLRTLPNTAITAAIDEPSLRAALEFMRTYDTGISSVRYPRDTVHSPSQMGARAGGRVSDVASESCPPFTVGKARPLTDACADLDSADAVILAFGTPALAALDAAASLAPEMRVAVYDARFAKPIDRELLRDLLSRSIPVVTIEDHSVIGGFGAAVLEAANEMQLDASRVTVLGLPDRWIYQDSRVKQLAEAGLDAPTIVRTLRSAAVRLTSREGTSA